MGPDLCDRAPDEVDTHGNPVRCEDCPVLDLENALENTAAGHLIQRAVHLDYLAQHGGGSAILDAPIDEFHAMRVLRDERAKWEAEKAKEQS